MAWIESHQELREHPKVHELVGKLGITKAQCLGHLHLFWWWCVDYYPDGKVRANDTAISRASEWTGDSKLFVGSLIESGFLDRGDGMLTVHDWLEYCGSLVEKRLIRKENKKVGAERINMASEREPTVPDRTVPNRTKPYRTKPKDKSMCADAHPPPNGTRFSVPSVSEVGEYIRSNRYDVSPDAFHAHYSANGWRVGKNQMRDWKSAVRTWHFREAKGGLNGSKNGRGSDQRPNGAAPREDGSKFDGIGISVEV